MGLLVAYLIVGAVPFTTFETDSLAIANSCQNIIDTGKFEDNILGHSFHMQTGTYFLIVTLAKLFRVATLPTYAFISLLAAVVYLIFLIKFLQILIKLNVLLIACTVFLFPSLTSLAYYPNSTVIASASWMAAFYLLANDQRTRTVIISGILLSIAGWMRIDILFAFPAVLPLLFLRTDNLKRSFLTSGVLLLMVVCITYPIMLLCNANISEFLAYTEYHGDIERMSNDVGALDIYLIRAHAASFPALIALSVLIGLFMVLKDRNWKLLYLFFSGIVFYYALGINNTIAPKHLSPLVPFYVLLVLYFFQHLISSIYYKRVLYFILIPLFVMQYVIGFTFDLKSAPYVNNKYSTLNPEPSILPLFSINCNKKNLSRVSAKIGTGTIIPSSDELIPSTGILFNPLYWYEVKKKIQFSRMGLQEYVDTIKESNFKILITDGSSQLCVNTLLASGYKWNNDTSDWIHNLNFKKTGGNTITIIRKKNFKKNDTASFMNNFRSMPEKRFLAVFLWDWQTYVMNEKLTSYTKIADRVYEIKLK